MRHISYMPLWHTLLNKNMKKEDLRIAAGLTTNMIANMGKNKGISMETLEKICDALVVEGGATGVPFRKQVPAYISLVEQPAKVMTFVKAHYGDTQRFAQGDIGMAGMNMCYQALELGLSTCILGLNDQQKMEEYFGIPQGSEVRLVIAVGYSAENKAPRRKSRKSIEEICSFNHW